MKTCIAVSPRKSAFSPLFFSGDIERGIKTASKLGCEAVEISINKPEKEEQDIIKKLLDDTGLAVASVATGQACVEDGLFFCSTDKKIRNKTVERVKAQLELAAELGSKLTIGGIRGKAEKYMAPEEAEKLIMDPVYECCEHAEKVGVEIIIEPVNHYEVGCIFTVKQAADFIKRLGHGSLCLLYDTYHVNMEERSIIQPLIAAGELLGHVHFADNNRLVPGYGCFDFTEVVRTLDSLDYNGYICIEALPLPDSDTAAKQAITYLNNIMDM